jgi:eukaryotic-like serine/threonine-protein kinase
MIKICPSCMRRYTEETLEACPEDGATLRSVALEGEGSLEGRVLEGRWLVEERIGEGGMGVVYRARQLNMERRVAIKTLHAELARGGEYMERFLREAEIASRISHPHLVAIHDFGQTEDHQLYIVMEYLDGESLGERMKRPMRLGMALELLSQVCMALSVAHEQGIIHRDLKPENIYLVRTAGAEVFAKVLDFGIAKVSGGAALTQTGKIFGTPQYMSPEQWRADRELRPTSDLYALGCILYELLSGRPPFEGDSFMELFYQHLQSVVPPLLPREGVVGGEEVLELMWQLLDKDAHRRPQDALVVKQMLERVAQRCQRDLLLPAWRPSDEAQRLSGIGDAATIEGSGRGIMVLAAREREVALAPAIVAREEDQALTGRLSAALGILVALGVVGTIGAALMSQRPLAAPAGAALDMAVAAAPSDAAPDVEPDAAREMAQDAAADATDSADAAQDMPPAAPDVAPDAPPEPPAPTKRGQRAARKDLAPKLEVRTKRTIQQRIRAQQRTLKACYDLAIRHAKAPPGNYEITARIRINERGEVAAVEILSDPLPEASLGGCVREKIGGWSFRVGLLGAQDTVTQTFQFEVKAGP